MFWKLKKQMKIDVYSNIYNEEEILPYWLRHYETFADRIFIWDCGSTDKTLDILKKHPKVTLLPLPPEKMSGFDDYYFVNYLYPQYEKYSRGVVDWVIIADADEFIYHPQIKEVLEKAKNDGWQLVQCEGFSMVSSKFPTTNGQIYDEIKTGFSDRRYSKWTIFSPDVFIRFSRGRHWRPYGFENIKKNRDVSIKLLHYRFVGRGYLERRTRRNIERFALVKSNTKTYNNNWITIETPIICPNHENCAVLKWFDKYKNKGINVI